MTTVSLFPEFHALSKAAGETNDCTVKALAGMLVALGGQAPHEAYETAHAALRIAGKREARKCSRGMLSAIKAVGLTFTTVYRQEDVAHRLTANNAGERLPKGVFLLQMKGHVACMIDGMVHDWTAGRKHRVIHAYQITVAK